MRKHQLIGMSLVGVLLNVALFSYYVGLQHGYDIGVATFRANDTFSVTGNGSELAQLHCYFGLLFSLFAIAKLVATGVRERLASICILIVTVAVYARWIGQMYHNSDLTFLQNLAASVALLDYASLTVLGALLFLQFRLQSSKRSNLRDVSEREK